MIKQRLQQAKSFYNTLDFNTASKVGAIVTKNKKLESTAEGKEYVVAGISLFPSFKGSCSHAASCAKLCIGFTGVSQMMKGSTNCNLSNVDKAMLKRLWIFNNKQEYFYRRANAEIEMMSVYGEIQVMFREISSECIDFRKFSSKNVTTYGYFKNPAKILQNSEINNVPQKAIYSWNEKSNKDSLDICKYVGMPVSVVVPKKLHKQMLLDIVETDNVYIHNGDISDLESHESYKEGKLNIHLLSEKTARYSNIIERPKFLDSYKKLLKHIK